MNLTSSLEKTDMPKTMPTSVLCDWENDDPVAVARRKAAKRVPGELAAVEPTRISRRRFMAASAVAAGSAAVAGLSGCSGSSRSSGSMTLTSGYIPIVDCIPIPIAYEKGFFKEFGIKAEKPTLIRAWAPLLEAFTAGQIKLTHVLLFQLVFMRYEQKLPVRSVAFNHLNGVAMLGGKGVKTFKELGGKVVGCPIWWAPHTLLFQECIRAAGLTCVVDKPGAQLKPNEVAFRVFPPPDMPNALKTGAISGAVVSETFGAASELLAGATLLRMTGDVWDRHPCCQSVLMQHDIDKDPSWAQAVTMAIAKACIWCEQNRGEMVDILSKEGGGYFPMPRKIIDRGCNYVNLEEYGVKTGTGAIRHPDWHVKRLSLEPYPYPSAFELAVDLMKRNVVDPSVAMSEELMRLDPKQAAREIVDYEMITKAIEKLGGMAQFGGVDPKDPYRREERYDV